MKALILVFLFISIHAKAAIDPRACGAQIAPFSLTDNGGGEYWAYSNIAALGNSVPVEVDLHFGDCLWNGQGCSDQTLNGAYSVNGQSFVTILQGQVQIMVPASGTLQVRYYNSSSNGGQGHFDVTDPCTGSSLASVSLSAGKP